jgi:hypothetical protein
MGHCARQPSRFEDDPVDPMVHIATPRWPRGVFKIGQKETGATTA